MFGVPEIERLDHEPLESLFVRRVVGVDENGLAINDFEGQLVLKENQIEGSGERDVLEVDGKASLLDALVKDHVQTEGLPDARDRTLEAQILDLDLLLNFPKTRTVRHAYLTTGLLN